MREPRVSVLVYHDGLTDDTLAAANKAADELMARGVIPREGEYYLFDHDGETIMAQVWTVIHDVRDGRYPHTMLEVKLLRYT